MSARRSAVLFLMVVGLTGPLLLLAQQAKPGKKVALLVGVQGYDHADLARKPVRYAENDVDELAQVLEPAGFQVILLTSKAGAKDARQRPTRANFQRELAAALRGVTRHDTILIALAGHGVQPEKSANSYFCPAEGNPYKLESLISLADVYKDLKESGIGAKIVLVDACRDDPKLGRGIAGEQAVRPPQGVGVFLSCRAGEIARETDELKHGVFFYHVLQGLKGGAKDSDGDITWESLVGYVKKKVERDYPAELTKAGAAQHPESAGEVSGTIVLRSIPRAGSPDIGKTTPQAARDNKTDKFAQPITKGQRVFTCGHSFHVFVPAILNDLAKKAETKEHVQVGLSSIGGSRVIQHWDVPDEKNKAKDALKAGNVDVLTLSPIFLPDSGIENFTKLALEHNKDIRITVQEFWLRWDIYEPTTAKPAKVNHNAITGEELWKRHAAYFKSIDEYVQELNKQHGKTVLYVVPAGQAVIALREKIIAGKAPGLKTQEDLFTDPLGHGQLPLQVLVAYCHYAVIYRRSPVGLPTPDALKQAKLGDDEEKLNRSLQELAWEAVTRHPLSGVQLP